MKSPLSEFVKILRESSEEKSVDPSDQANGSIDRQVRKYIRNALNAAAKTSKTESVDLRCLRDTLLREVDDDEGGKEPDAGAQDATQPEKKDLESIELGEFAEAIDRLVHDFVTVIETKDIVMRMARAALEQSYDDSVLDEYDEILRTEYDIEVGGTQWDKEIENQPPLARNAGPTGA